MNTTKKYNKLFHAFRLLLCLLLVELNHFHVINIITFMASALSISSDQRNDLLLLYYQEYYLSLIEIVNMKKASLTIVERDSNNDCAVNPRSSQ